jgi:hypothetical protein
MSDYWPLYVLLAALIASGAFLTLRDWRVGALLIAAALPFEGLLPGLGAGGMKALTGAALLGLALHLMRNAALLARALANLRSGLSLALLALIAWSALSMLWALEPLDALARTVTFCGVFALLHLFALLDPPSLRRTWLVLLASAALTVPVGLTFGGPDAFTPEGRFASGGLNPNDYAGLLTLTLFLALAKKGSDPFLKGPVEKGSDPFLEVPMPKNGSDPFFGRPAKNGSDPFLPLVLGLGMVVLAGVFLSGSRTALVALAAAPVLHLLLVPGAARRLAIYRATAAYAAAAVVLLAAFHASPPQAGALRERAMTLTDYRSADTWAGRLNLWRGGVEMARERPLLGVGAGNFPVAATAVSGMPRRAEDGRGQVAHNVFVGIAAELGLPGLALFGAMWIAALRKARVAARACDAVLLALLGCLLMSLSLSWEYAKVTYLLMGSALALAGAHAPPAATTVAARTGTPTQAHA